MHTRCHVAPRLGGKGVLAAYSAVPVQSQDCNDTEEGHGSVTARSAAVPADVTWQAGTGSVQTRAVSQQQTEGNAAWTSATWVVRR
jgi:hypothetical protein